MQTEWKNYWKGVRTHALQTFVLYPPLMILFFSATYYFGNGAEGAFADYLGHAAIYSYSMATPIFALYSIFHALLYRFEVPKISGRGIQRHIPVHIGITLVGIVIGVFIADKAISVAFNREPMSVAQWIGDVMAGAVIGLAFIFFYAYNKTKNAMHLLEKSTIESQYRTLKDQMQPHFLFNSLNGLSELIHQNAVEAATMATKLADLYRGILENSKTKTTGLRSELAIVDDYLALQSLRFGPNLRYSIAHDLGEEDPHIPSLILQTLVENAVKHGIAKSPSGGEVLITAAKNSAGWLCIKIANTGAPFKNSAGEGTGLVNTRRRLDLLYGDKHGFSIGQNSQSKTVVEFSCPGGWIE